LGIEDEGGFDGSSPSFYLVSFSFSTAYLSICQYAYYAFVCLFVCLWTFVRYPPYFIIIIIIIIYY